MTSKLAASIVISLILSAATSVARAQAVTSVSLAGDQIGEIKTAQGITTRVSFPDEVDEIICGDLYDAASGKGSFVAQRSGNDVFLKPIPAKGMSNLFVKTRGKRVYNFDLLIVPIAQSNRVVNVSDATTLAHARQGGDLVEQARRQADDIIKDARARADDTLADSRQQARRIIGDAEAKAADIDRQSVLAAAAEAERRFVQALMLGLRESKIDNTRVTSKQIVVMLDPRVFTFEGKSYLRYTLQNTGDADFNFSGVSLESGSGRETRQVPVTLVQSKSENRLVPGESLTGVLTFDPGAVTAKDKLTLFVRGADDLEITRVTIQ